MIYTNPLVSIIVPVFNMEELLPKCLDSILGQTYDNIELVIIDDGSKDNSGSICDKYAIEDKRVKVIHQQNNGIAGAINRGLDNITGKFFLFVDSDDYIAPGMIERLLSLQLEHDADIVQCGRYSFPVPEGIGYKEQKQGEVFIYRDREEILEDFFHHKRISRNLAARVFKTDLFDGIRCEPGRMIIDAVTLPQVLMKCDKYLFVDENYYYVYETPSSASRSIFTMRKWEDWKFGNAYIKDLIERNCPQYIDYVYYKYVYSSKNAFVCIRRNKEEPNQKQIMLESKSIFKKYYPQFKKSNYYKSLSKSEKNSFTIFNYFPLIYCRYKDIQTLFIKKLRALKY